MSKLALNEISAGALKQPGTEFALRSFAALHRFEDLIAPFVDSDFNHELWLGRPTVEETIAVNRDLADDITLRVLAKPQEALEGVSQNGWQFQERRGQQQAKKNFLQGKLLGFELTTALEVSGRDDPEEVRRRLWYAPVRRVKGGRIQDSMGKGLLRLIALPEADLAALSATSSSPSSDIGHVKVASTRSGRTTSRRVHHSSYE